MSRNTPPPSLPPKDYSSSRHSSYTNNNTHYANHDPTDLAAAIRDTVHISSKSSNASLRQQSQAPHRSYSPSNLQSSHSYTKSSPDMSHVTQAQAQHQQPMLPSAMVHAVNPFDEDEIEPERRKTKGSAPPRQKVGRAASG
jgi:hypothetical protein